MASKDYSFLKVLFHMIGVDETTKPMKMEELFDTKHCQIHRYLIHKTVFMGGDLWLMPLDKMKYSVLKLTEGQIIVVRDDLKKPDVDISYTYKGNEEVASVRRAAFDKIMDSLYLLPPTKIRGSLEETVKEIYKYYRMNNINEKT